MFKEIGVDRGRHVFRGQEAWVIWIDQGGEGCNRIHVRQQCVILDGMTIACEASLAFL